MGNVSNPPMTSRRGMLAFAMAEPARMSRRVLEAFTYTGKARQPSPNAPNKPNSTAPITGARAMLLSIFTRDKPGTTDPAVAELFADAEIKYGDTVPTGPTST